MRKIWHFLDFAGALVAILKIAAILNFSVVNSDVLTLRNIKIHELHVQIDGKIRNLLTFWILDAILAAILKMAAILKFLVQNLDSVMSENVKFMYCMAEFIKK